MLPITAGKLDLGPWEQVFYAEFDGQRRKRVVVKAFGLTAYGLHAVTTSAETADLNARMTGNRLATCDWTSTDLIAFPPTIVGVGAVVRRRRYACCSCSARAAAAGGVEPAGRRG